VVDACGRTADPAVFACGDCTATRQAGQGLRRLESVQNAVEQGKAVAAAMLGKEKPFVATPWFWSDQYDAKLQMVGTSSDFDTQVIRGEPDEGKFSVFYFRLGRLIGIDSINRPQDHMLGRKLLDRGLSPTQQQVTDEAFALNSLLA
jgi:3-phenylpropionate/trans-cinnamate dioxygenase ferredoxin reductase subunit